ncbi:hypothetical protein WNY59_02220 [Ahrensia kielensis]|uniref:Uncharacterized protein n=1 Tax=Ahrensia kielensis TaxID=76980 RepID=A0ABU9T2Q1_9HYPH
MLTGCQSTTDNGQVAASEEFDVSTKPNSFAATSTASSRASAGKCAIELASGPPAKPAKGADFAKNAVGKNIARNVGRNILGNLIGGGAVGATVASQVVRTEQDLGGKWLATDGSNNCGCEIQIRTGAGVIAQGFGRTSGYKLRDAKGGSMSNLTCSNPQLAAINRFALGYSFTGYDATLAVEAKNGAPIAKLKRDGINYFSGNLADGTPITFWRRSG